MTNDSEAQSVHLLAAYMSSLERWLSRAFAHFLFFLFCLFFRILDRVLCQIYVLWTFPPVCGLSITFLNCVSLGASIFYFDGVWYAIFFSFGFSAFCVPPGNLCLSKGSKGILCFLLEAFWFWHLGLGVWFDSDKFLQMVWGRGEVHCLGWWLVVWAWVQILPLPLTGCLVLGKLLNTLGLSFLVYEMGIVKVPMSSQQNNLTSLVACLRLSCLQPSRSFAKQTWHIAGCPFVTVESPGQAAGGRCGSLTNADCFR